MIRTLLVLVCLLALALAVWAMWAGWRHRARRQAGLPPLPEPPPDLDEPLLPPLSGLYVGTTSAASWQDRIVAHGLGVRADATIALYGDGLLIDRVVEAPIFIPSWSVVEARLAPALAGKVVGAGGLLVVRWRHGDAELDTGVRADDKSAYPQWVLAINQRIPA